MLTSPSNTRSRQSSGQPLVSIRHGIARAAAVTIASSTVLLGSTVMGASQSHADPCSAGGQGIGCGVSDGGSGSGTGGTGSGGGGGGSTDIPEVDQNGEGGPGAPDPELQPPPAPATQDLAEQARSSAQLPLPTVHTAPSNKTFVGLRTRLWVDGFEPVSTAPISAGDQTVVATATPSSVTWHLGETSIICQGPGGRSSDACSHVFRRSSTSAPGGAHQITATITFNVTWTCTGSDCDSPGGALDPLTSTSLPHPLVVSEIQTNSRP